MEKAIFIAKIASVLYLAIGLGVLINPSSMKKLLDEFIKSPGLTYLASWITIICGMLIVLSYNIWEANLGLIVTILGWLAIIKGISLIIFPQKLMKISLKFSSNGYLIGILIIILGLLFGYLGFFG